METSICGLDCTGCAFYASCAGCAPTGGRPFGGKKCPLAECCQRKGGRQCTCPRCTLKEQLLGEIKALNLEELMPVRELYALKGSYVNLLYTLPDGRTFKLFDDDEICLGCQVEGPGGKCLGIAADEARLVISQYGENGADAEIVLYKKRAVDAEKT